MTKKSLTLVILAVAVLTLAGLAWKQYRNEDKPSDNIPTETINFNPPTEEEKKAGDNVEAKKNTTPVSSQGTQQNTNPGAGIGSASVAITDASKYGDQVEVRAFVSNIVSDGICTYTFTSGSKKVIKTSPAKADASTTNCLTLNFNVSELSGSTKWTVTVKYENQQKTITGETQGELNL
jgi:hypothetical protein